jgi:uncharacterized protein (TIGR00159 family)
MQWLNNFNTITFVWRVIDWLAVLALVYFMLALNSDRRILLMVRGFILLLIFNIVSKNLQLELLTFVLDKLLVGAAVGLAVMLQPELRRFLEQLGRGDMLALLRPAKQRRVQDSADNAIDEIVDAVKELSRNRIGALIVMETGEPIDEHSFSVSGVRLNAELSKELLQTIFQTSTLLHDGAVLMRDERIVAAGVILPLSARSASREIGTRHRAAMGITEQVTQCFCIVVSEETGSIAIAENGSLDRPVTSARLREVLEMKLASNRPVTLVGTVPRFSWLWSWLNMGKKLQKSPPIKK